MFVILILVLAQQVSALGQHPGILAPWNQPRSTCDLGNGKEGRCVPMVMCRSYGSINANKGRTCLYDFGRMGVCCPRRRSTLGSFLGKGLLFLQKRNHVNLPIFNRQNLESAISRGAKRFHDKKRRHQRFAFIRSSLGSAKEEDERFVVRPERSHALFGRPIRASVIEKGERARSSLETSKVIAEDLKLSKQDSKDGLQQLQFNDTSVCNASTVIRCGPPSVYRSIDGSCNNLNHPEWGMAGVQFRRVINNDYGDGISTPRLSIANTPLPSARLVSTTVNPNRNLPDLASTLLLMQWGQFLDHDLTSTPVSRGDGNTPIVCCQNGQPVDPSMRNDDCFPIDIPANDPFYAQFNQRCMSFIRSQPAPRSDCKFGPRQQMNQITAFLDCSNIYGSSADFALSLRELRGGLLKEQVVNGRPLLPRDEGQCLQQQTNRACFLAGDARVNEQMQLAVMHTVWMREHNRIARQLAQLLPNANDETLYQETRRVVNAEYQHITYNEFLPVILGEEMARINGLELQDEGFASRYNASLDATIANVFATAAYRFGHSLITDNTMCYARNGTKSMDMLLHTHQFQPFPMYDNNAIGDCVRGVTTQVPQQFDWFFVDEITKHLFQGSGPFGLDLFALNIKRGRDHGLPSYNEFRKLCRLKPAATFDDLSVNMPAVLIGALKSVYQSVEDIDIYVGGVSEKRLPGAILGETFACLVTDQFLRLRLGDRFFYEEGFQKSSFTAEQLAEIRKSSIARVFCDNSDNLEIMQPLAFLAPKDANVRVSCKNTATIPVMDLSKWKLGAPKTTNTAAPPTPIITFPTRPSTFSPPVHPPHNPSQPSHAPEQQDNGQYISMFQSQGK